MIVDTTPKVTGDLLWFKTPMFRFLMVLTIFSTVGVSELTMSFGFHYFETTNMSLTLQYFDTATSPKVFGRLRSLAAASNIAAGILIISLSAFFNYARMNMVIGTLVIISVDGGLPNTILGRSGHEPGVPLRRAKNSNYCSKNIV